MAKKRGTKRPRENGNISINLKGISDSHNHVGASSANDALEECLAELESSIFSGIASTTAANDASSPSIQASVPSKDSNLNDISSNDAKPQSVNLNHSKLNRDQVEAWNSSFLEWSKNIRRKHHKASSNASQGTDLFPNINVELSRHYKVMDLSTFLIDECKRRNVELRMPSFERWLIDSKLEEQFGSTTNDDHSKSNAPISHHHHRHRHRQHHQPSQHQHHQHHHYEDPVLPSRVSARGAASCRLIEEISQSGTIPSSQASKVVSQLCQKTFTAVQEITAERIRMLHQPPLRKGDRIELEHHHTSSSSANNRKDGNGDNENDEASVENDQDDNDIASTSHRNYYSIVLHRKNQTHPVCVKINVAHYDKLVARFLEVHQHTRSHDPRNQISHLYPNPTTPQQARIMQGFHLLLMLVLLRYSSLSGGHLLKVWRGGGMQGACHEQVFQVLQDHFATAANPLECFASPLNAYLPQFASAFVDLDWHFGSVGSFFSSAASNNDEYAKVGGLYQANPPFCPGLMMHMATTMLHHLALADSPKYDTALCFVVIVPTVHLETPALSANSKEGRKVEEKGEESLVKRHAKPSFEQMVSSSYCRMHIILPAREHGYMVGAQHVRPTLFKQSNYDTSVIVLQSQKARQTMNFDEQAFEQDIRNAFASREDEEIEQRKKRAKQS